MRRLLVFLCVVSLAGCGGDEGGGSKAGGGGESGGGDRLTKAEFTAEGKRICQKGANRTKEVVAEEAGKADVKSMSETERGFHLLEKARPVVEETMDEIDALEAPEAVEGDVKTLTDGVREAQDLLAGIDGEADAEKAAPRLQELVKETREAARSAGLEACLPENTA